MNTKGFILLSLVLSFLIGVTQLKGDVKWYQTFNMPIIPHEVKGYDIAIDSVNDLYVLAAVHKHLSSAWSFYLLKYSSATGNLIWKKKIPCLEDSVIIPNFMPCQEKVPRASICIYNDNIYAALQNSRDMVFLYKINSSGEIMKQMLHTTSIATGNIDIYGIAADNNGVYIAGNLDVNGTNTHRRIYVAKFDLSLDNLSIEVTNNYCSASSETNNILYGITVDNNGGVYAVGKRFSGGNQVLIIKYTNTTMTKVFFKTNDAIDNFIYGSDILVKGNYIFIGGGVSNGNISILNAKFTNSPGAGYTFTSHGNGFSNVYGSGIAVDSATNRIVIGYESGYAKVWVVKTSPSGTGIWTNMVVNSTIGDSRGFKLAVDNSNNIYYVGWFYENMSPSHLLLGKLDPSGNKIWTNHTLLNIEMDSELNSITYDGSSYVYISGFTVRTDSFPAYIAKKDLSGNTIWSQILTGNKAGGNLHTGIKYFNNELYLCTTVQTNSTNFYPLGVLSKLDNTGTFVWQITNTNVSFRDIEVDTSGNIYVTGSKPSGTEDLILVRKFDSSGNFQWDYTYTNSNSPSDHDTGTGIKITNNKVYVAGFVQQGSSYGNFTAVLDTTSGIEEWHKIISPTTSAENYSTEWKITADKDGNVYTAGLMAIIDTNTLQVDTQYGVIVKYDSAGNQVWRKEYDPSTPEFEGFVDIEIKGDYLYVAGSDDLAYDNTTESLLSGRGTIWLISPEDGEILDYSYHEITDKPILLISFNCINENEAIVVGYIQNLDGIRVPYIARITLPIGGLFSFNSNIIVTGGSWNLIGISSSNSFEAKNFAKDKIGESLIYQWNPLAEGEEWEKYTRMEEGELKSGKGYWIYPQYTAIFKPSPIIAREKSETVDIQLYKGWNLIAAPFLFACGELSIVSGTGTNEVIKNYREAGEYVDTRIWGWGEYGYYSMSGDDILLLPWQGYWVYAKKDCILRIKGEAQKGYNQMYSGIVMRAGREIEKNREVSAKRWIGWIGFKSGRSADMWNYIGVEEGASDGIGIEDSYEAPGSPGEGVKVSIGKLSYDIRRPVEKVKVWEVIVEGGSKYEDGILEWDLRQAKEAGLSLAIVDKVSGEIISRNATGKLKVEGSKEGIHKEYLIKVAAPGYEDLLTGGIKIIEKKGYPNPVIGGRKIRIRYKISEDSKVQVKIYDISGKKVWGGGERDVIAGEEVEEIVDTAGMSSGVYIYQIEARSKITGRRKITRDRFVVIK